MPIWSKPQKKNLKKIVPYHREIDIAGIELHVDLLVDESLGLLVEVHTDPAVGRHRFSLESNLGCLYLVCCSWCWELQV